MVISSAINIIVLAFFFHPIYVSVTEIEFDEKEKALEIMMRVNGEDLETTLRNKLKQPNFDILEPENRSTIDKMVSDYMKEHFKITLDNKLQKSVYLGHEREAEALILYIEISNVKKWKTIQIFNDILTETHEEQSNLVHVSVRDKVLSLRLTKDVPANKLTFDF